MAMAAVAGWAALAGSIKLAAAAIAIYSIYKTFKEPGQLTGPTASGDPFADVAGGARKSDLVSGRKLTVPTEQEKFQNFTAAERQKKIDAAIAKWIKDFGDKPVSGKGGGAGAKETADNLLAPMLAMFKTKREAELHDAQNSLDLLKSTNNKKKAELEKNLAEGLIDGRTYYLRLQELQQAETTAALAMIERKKSAQVKAYEESLTQLEADQKLSPEAKAIAEQKLAAENHKALAKLDTEAAQARLDGEVKITKELERQAEVRKQYQQKTEDLNLETAQLLGAITEQEAKLQRLVIDWQREKDKAIKAEAGPEYFTALDANLAAKQFDAKYGESMRGISSEFSSGVVNIINGIRQGSFDIGNALIQMFNNIMMAALKPGFDALGQVLTNAVKGLLQSAASAMGISWGGGPGTSGYDYQPGGYGFMNWAHGGAFSRGVRMAFAGGGIVTRPTLFPLAGGAGLMGEAGEEGILPLSRVGGDLGVKALLPSSGPPVVNIINKTGTEAQGSAQQNDDGSLDVFLEKKVVSYASRGPLNQLIRAISKS
jgi:hypothetical protein